MSPRAARRAVLALCALGAVATALPFWFQVNDDAWITFRYARSLALGDGPYYNPGERVEGYTNFLLMLATAAAIAVGGPGAGPLVAKAIGLASFAAAAALAAALAARLGVASPGVAAAAGGLVAASAGLALNATTGLETALFAALLTAGLFAGEAGHAADRWRGAGVLFALAALTRPEGAYAFAAVAAGRLVAGEGRGPARRRLLLDGALVAATVAAHLLWRHATYDGEWLPNTYHAKAGGFGAVPPLEYVRRFVWWQLTPFLAPCALLPLALGAVEARRRALPPLALVAAGLLAVPLAGSDWMPGFRLLVPYLPAWAALGAVGLGLLLDRFRVAGRGQLVAVAVAVAAAFGWQAGERRDLLWNAELRARGYAFGHAAAADFVAARARPGDTVAVMDIGVIGWRLPAQRILDVTGLTDRDIARAPGGFLDKPAAVARVLAARPRFVILVFTAPAGGGALSAWSPIERRLWASPEFRAAYSRPRSHAGLPPLAGAAAFLGAEAVFDHAYVKPYLLAVFERRPD